MRWFVLVLLSVSACVTTDKRAQSAARNSIAWCESMALDCPGSACSGVDSDLDGYVSCTVSTSAGNRIPIECGYDEFFAPLGQNTGCREQRAVNFVQGE